MHHINDFRMTLLQGSVLESASARFPLDEVDGDGDNGNSDEVFLR
jgi:hypothetical protein